MYVIVYAINRYGGGNVDHAFLGKAAGKAGISQQQLKRVRKSESSDDGVRCSSRDQVIGEKRYSSGLLGEMFQRTCSVLFG